MLIDFLFFECGDLKFNAHVTNNFSEQSREDIIFEALNLGGLVQISTPKYLSVSFYNYDNFKNFYKKIADFL